MTTIQHVHDFWNNRPCNIRHSSQPMGTREYFEEVTQRKYFVEPHILGFADFARFKKKRVLEVGCGIGTAAQSFIEAGALYTGFDLSERSVELSKQRLELFGLSGHVFQANIEDMGFEEKEPLFDLVYSFGVLHHTPNIEKAISNCFQFLKPGGEFKLMLYAKNSLKYWEITEGEDQFEAQSGVPIANVYTPEEVRDLLSDFTNIKIEQTHIFPYQIEPYKRYEYVKKEYFQTMSPSLFAFLERNLGWHLCITCQKPWM